MSSSSPKTGFRWKTRLLIPLLAATVLLAACSEETKRSGEPEEKLVGGTVNCTVKSLDGGIKAWAEAYGDGENTVLSDRPGSYKCADDWAVAFPESGPGDAAVTVTVVLQAEGQFWIPKDRAKVCGDTAADSEVPAKLFRDACQTN